MFAIIDNYLLYFVHVPEVQPAQPVELKHYGVILTSGLLPIHGVAVMSDCQVNTQQVNELICICGAWPRQCHFLVCMFIRKSLALLCFLPTLYQTTNPTEHPPHPWLLSSESRYYPSRASYRQGVH